MTKRLLDCPALLALLAPLALAAAPALAAMPDPLDAQAATRPLTHRSAFEGYRRINDEPAVPWREANETVKRIGGWRAYAREAAQDGTAAPAAAAPSAPRPAIPGSAAAAKPAAPASAPVHRH